MAGEFIKTDTISVASHAGTRSPARPVGLVRWMIVACVLAIAAISYLDRNNISIAARFLQEDFQLSNVQLGVVFSAFIVGYALSQPVAGYIADRFGPTRLIALAIVWWSLFTAAVPLVPAGVRGAMGILLSVRFLLGVGEAVIFPASNRLVAAWIPSEERGLANGLIFAGVGVGGGIAPPLITYIMLRHSWRWAFWVSAMVGIVAGVLWSLLVRDRPADHKAMSAKEIAYLEATLPAPRRKAERVRVREIFLDRQIWILTLSYFCFGYVAYMFFTWFFKYLSDVRGLNLQATALYATLPFVAMALASSLGGLFSDRLLRVAGKRVARCGVAAASLLVASVFVWVATQVADARVAALVLAGGAGALYFAQSSFWAMSADIGGEAAGTVSGVMNMGSQIGGAVTAYITPVIANAYGWTASFATAAVICVCGAAAWLFIEPFHVLGPKVCSRS
jgi:MFS transporter, ACS family, glucarate transporter